MEGEWVLSTDLRRSRFDVCNEQGFEAVNVSTGSLAEMGSSMLDPYNGGGGPDNCRAG